MNNNNKFIKVLPGIQHLDFNKCDLALSLFMGKLPTGVELENLEEMVSAIQHKDLITKRVKNDEETFGKIEELAKFYKLSIQHMVNIIFLWSKDNELLLKEV